MVVPTIFTDRNFEEFSWHSNLFRSKKVWWYNGLQGDERAEWCH